MSQTELQLDTLNTQNLQVMRVYVEREDVARVAAKAAAKEAAKATRSKEEAASDEESPSAIEAAADSFDSFDSFDGFDGWLDRIDQMPEFSADELTRQHGQLIALGFLQFEISGRSVGLRYKISTRGRKAMDRAVAIAARQNVAESHRNDDTDDLDVTDDAEFAEAA
jgi:hypothetical protein